MDLQLLYERDGDWIAFPIEEGETFIGRKDYCDICFPDSSVSKRHVRIVRTGTKVELFDAGSKNGTLVNGKEVDHVPLVEGDVIQLGKITLTVAGGEPSANFKKESRASRSQERAARGSGDSFNDFDDFDEGTDDNEAVKVEEPPGGGGAGAGGDGPPRSAKTKKKKTTEPRAREPEEALEPSLASEAAPAPASGSQAPSQAPSAVAPPPARFVVTAGETKGSRFELAGDKPITIGTKEENGIPLKGEGISRYHAEVVLENGVWVLKDLGSRNGTFVGDRKVDLHELAPGDVVQVGTTYLRFDQDVPALTGTPAEQVKQLVELLKKDPKAFLKSQQGLRAIMIVLAILIAIVFLAPNGDPGDPGRPGGGQSTDLTALPHQIIDLLSKDDAAKARTLIANTTATFKAGQDRPFLKDLDDLAKVWEDHKQPFTFDWKEAIQVLERVQRNGKGELDKDSLDWLATAERAVTEEEPNSRLASKGFGELIAAQNALRAGNTKESIAKFKDALNTYRQIPKKSVLFAPGISQADKARSALFRLLQKEAERLAAMDPPPWQDAIDCLNEAIEYASSLDEKTPVRKRIEELEINQHDEEAFAKAVDIVTRRNVARYDEAITLLNSISKTSRIAVDAQTYLHWIQADRDVRNAKTAYDEGNWDKARGLLESALRVAELGPDARQSVTRRLDAWSAVVKALQEGMALSAAGDDAAALVKLDDVLRLEPNSKNRFHVLAEGEKNSIQERGDKWLDQKLQDGLTLLERGRYRDAYDKFHAITKNAADTVRRAKIEQAVQKVNTDKRIFQECYKQWQTNENAMYEGVLDKLLVVGTYLPKDDPERPRARELYRKIHERLKTAMDQHRPDEEDDPK